MNQKSFNSLVSIDWLSLSLESATQIDNIPGIVSPRESFAALTSCVNVEKTELNEEDLKNLSSIDGSFMWTKRPYGTKQFKSLFDIDLISEDGAIEPFGVFMSVPTSDKWKPRTCSLKLANHLLYQDSGVTWYAALNLFLQKYDIRVRNISRADIAADFIYLYNRVSGSQLANNILNFKWWKCGTVNISMHASLPYSIKWQRDFDHEGYEVECFLNNGQLQNRVETLTFGSGSSDVQVQLYDKTLELRKSDVSVSPNPDSPKVCAKEYIRDAHKAAGVFDEKRHTWRLEFRLKNEALFMYDMEKAEERALTLEDLTPDNIRYTFLCAQDKYFRIVDPTNGGTVELTPQYLQKMRTHKNRMPVIKLFDSQSLLHKLVKKPFHETANSFNRNVINRLDQLGDRLQRTNGMYSKSTDLDAITRAIKTLDAISSNQEQMREVLLPLVGGLSELWKRYQYGGCEVDENDLQIIAEAREVLERHLRTEAPRFSQNIALSLEKFRDRLDLQHSTPEGTIAKAKIRPSDGEILSEAANIMRGVFISTIRDQRETDERNIHKKYFEANMQYLIQGGLLDDRQFKYIKYCFSKESPFSFEEIANYRKLYMSKLLLEVLRCYSFPQYAKLKGIYETDPNDDLLPQS